MLENNIIKKDIQVTPIFEQNFASTAQTVVNVGGARSSKSYSIAQLFILFYQRQAKYNIGICRKTMPSLKMTNYRLVIDLMRSYEMYDSDNHNLTLNYYDNPDTGTRIQFFSIDKPDRLKSTEFNYIWMEEANEFTYQDYMLLLTRLSAFNPLAKNQIFLSLNPDDENGWIRKKILMQPDVQCIKSTYKDNIFLDKNYVMNLESLKKTDPAYFKIYGDGEWGSFQSRIYNEYDFADEVPANPDLLLYGIDFGYNNPSCLIRVMIKDKQVYTQEVFYKTKMLNDEIISALKKEIPDNQRHLEIYADSAESDRIKEISDAGFNVKPAIKNVRLGIDAVKKSKIKIHKDSRNIIDEIQTYKWKIDNNGDKIDEPVKINDHAMDAIRYAIYSFVKEYGEGNTGLFSGMGL